MLQIIIHSLFTNAYYSSDKESKAERHRKGRWLAQTHTGMGTQAVWSQSHALNGQILASQIYTDPEFKGFLKILFCDFPSLVKEEHALAYDFHICT